MPKPVLILDEQDQVVKDPKTGEPVTDPLLRFAILNGYWYENKHGITRPKWDRIARAVMPHWDIPRYFGFTEDEQQIYYKLCSEAFYPLRSVGYLLGLLTPRSGIRFVLEKHIPLYKINLALYVFSGDIVRAVSASRVDYDDPVVRAVVEGNIGRRWDGHHWKNKSKDAALRPEGSASGAAADPKGVPDAQDPRGHRKRAFARHRGDRGRFQ